MYRKFCSVNNKKDNKLNMEYANDSIWETFSLIPSGGSFLGGIGSPTSII